MQVPTNLPTSKAPEIMTPLQVQLPQVMEISWLFGRVSQSPGDADGVLEQI